MPFRPSPRQEQSTADATFSSWAAARVRPPRCRCTFKTQRPCPRHHRPADGFAVGGERTRADEEGLAERADRRMPGADSAPEPDTERLHHGDGRTGHGGCAVRGSGDHERPLARSPAWNSCRPQGLFDTAGVRTTGGSALFADRVPTEDAEVVRRLKAAGAVIVGKQNMHEFALGATSAASHFGPVHNPWNRDYVAGGSSGGSAAAVAASLCYGALGSDTGGSIRIPASFCSIVGLKPTYGRVSTRGVIPLSWSLDHVGLLTRTVFGRRSALASDCRLRRSGDNQRRSTGAALRGSRQTRGIVAAGWCPAGILFRRIGPRCGNGSRAGARRPLQAVRSRAGGHHPGQSRCECDRAVGGSLCVSCGTNTRGPAIVSASRVGTSALGETIDTTTYIERRRELDQMRRAAAGLFAHVDLLVTPTVPLLPVPDCRGAGRRRRCGSVCAQHATVQRVRFAGGVGALRLRDKRSCRSVCRSSVRPGERSPSSASLTRSNRQPTGRHDVPRCDALNLSNRWPAVAALSLVTHTRSNLSNGAGPPNGPCDGVAAARGSFGTLG